MDDLEKVEKVRTLIDGFDTGMLITRDVEGRAHIRPMRVAAVDDDLLITFLTALDSRKVDEVRRRGNVAVAFQSKATFVALTGYAQVVADPVSIEKVWSPAANAWLKGPEDPDAALVAVQPETIEYWDNQGFNMLKTGMEMIQAIATGTRPEMSDEAHGRVSI